MINLLLKNKLFPGILQWGALLFFVAVIWGLLFGPADKDNPANLLVWLIWWPMLCVLFIFAGRIWCAVCPFSLLSDLAQRVVGVQSKVPDFLKQHGGWLILISFLLLSWLEETTGIVGSPRKTSVMLLGILAGAVAFGLFFRGRAWCRYVCPLGGISLVYARTSLVKIRSNDAVCAECLTKDCMVPDQQYAGCPMHVTPFAMDSVANCNVCGECVKRCPNDSLQVAFEAPSRDLTSNSGGPSVVVWLIIFLSGLISFLNSLESPRLPVESWLEHTTYPVLAKTLLLTAALTAGWLLFSMVVRLARSNTGDVPRSQLLSAAALPMIPLLLFSHLGHVCAELWGDGGALLKPLAVSLDMPWLQLNMIWGAAWTKYFSPLCIITGMLLSLGVSWWAAERASGWPDIRTRSYFLLFYAVFAGWNLFATWPVSITVKPETVLSETAAVSAAASVNSESWTILWLLFGILAALLALALIVRHSSRQSGAAEKDEFSANRSWVFCEADGGKHAELFEWLLEQAIQARWRLPAVVGLANAGQEIVSFLQRTLPGSAITVNAILRKNKGVLTILHEGQPLALPNYKSAVSLDEIDDAALEGIELRLAAGQVEYMSYQAKLSDVRCSFTLRQSC